MRLHSYYNSHFNCVASSLKLFSFLGSRLLCIASFKPWLTYIGLNRTLKTSSSCYLHSYLFSIDNLYIEASWTLCNICGCNSYLFHLLKLNSYTLNMVKPSIFDPTYKDFVKRHQYDNTFNTSYVGLILLEGHCLYNYFL